MGISGMIACSSGCSIIAGSFAPTNNLSESDLYLYSQGTSCGRLIEQSCHLPYALQKTNIVFSRIGKACLHHLVIEGKDSSSSGIHQTIYFL